MSRFGAGGERFIRSILPTVVGLIVLVSLVSAAAERMPGAVGVVVAIGGGILVGLGALTLRAVARDVRSLHWLRTAVRLGVDRPADGRPIVVEGRIRSDPVLTAPISAARCGAYFFRIGQQQRALGDSTGSRRAVVAAGLRLADAVIETGDRTVPLRALPEVDHTLGTVGSGTAHAAAVGPLIADLMNAPPGAPVTVEALRLTLRDGATGPVDRVVRTFTEPPSVDARMDVQEEIVPIDRPVCVLGCFGAVSGGLVPGRGRALHLYAGTFDEVSARLGREVRGFGIVAAVLLSAGSGLLAVAWF